VIRITGLFMTVLWSHYLQCLYFFPGGVSRGQGTKSKQIFPSPAAQSFMINGGRGSTASLRARQLWFRLRRAG